MRYARDTNVSAEKSRAEIERILMRYGAAGFAYATDHARAAIKFKMENRHVRFVLPFPDRSAKEFTHSHGGKHERHPDDAYRAWEQACRQRWRALSLAVKAKLETVEAGIATFEEEFLNYILLPNGKTVGEMAQPQIDQAYSTGKMPPLLDFRG